MGIRFQCPNGHKLNVKSFLAGKKGICPHCGAKFRIPVESDPALGKKSKSTGSGPALELVDEPAAEPAGVGTATLAPAAEALPQANNVAGGVASDPIAEAPNAVWYVRPPSGGQYGPASGDILRNWITEGRVSAETLVWREGWPEWQPAGPLFPGLSQAQAAVSSAAAPSAAASSNTSADPVAGENGAVTGNSVAYHRLKQGRSKRTSTVVVAMLIIASLGLLVALLFVLSRMNGGS